MVVFDTESFVFPERIGVVLFLFVIGPDNRASQLITGDLFQCGYPSFDLYSGIGLLSGLVFFGFNIDGLFEPGPSVEFHEFPGALPLALGATPVDPLQVLPADHFREVDLPALLLPRRPVGKLRRLLILKPHFEIRQVRSRPTRRHRLTILCLCEVTGPDYDLLGSGVVEVARVRGFGRGR